MGTAKTNIELYTRLNTELVSMVDQFTNLIKGTKEGELLVELVIMTCICWHTHALATLCQHTHSLSAQAPGQLTSIGAQGLWQCKWFGAFVEHHGTQWYCVAHPKAAVSSLPWSFVTRPPLPAL
jgi:hypothetical protein